MTGAAPGGIAFDDLVVGMSASLEKTVSDEDVRTFAAVTGDTNPVHLDDAFAAGTIFRGRIAHGMLPASLIAAVLGTRLPGPGSIYLGQRLGFVSPVRIGDTVTARVTVDALEPDGNRVTLRTVCEVGSRVVLEGSAEVYVPGR